MVQCVCIQFFPPTAQNHVAASRLLMGSVSHSPLQCLGALLLAQVSDVLRMDGAGDGALQDGGRAGAQGQAGDSSSSWGH